MAQKSAIVGGEVHTPLRRIRDGLVVITDGQIEWVGSRGDYGDLAGRELIDAQDKLVAPGFIDIHVHGAAGSDFMDATLEDFDAICRHHATGGTTSLLATTASAPLKQIVAALETVREAMACPPQGAQVVGAHLEGPFFCQAKRGCHGAQWVRNPTYNECQKLLEYRDVVKHITLTPEVEGGMEAVRAFAGAGITVSAGHTEATYDEMVAALDAGLSHATHIYVAMSTTIRRIPYRCGGCVEAVLLREELTTELIADGIHLMPELMKLVVKVKGVDRVCLVTDAMRGAGMPDGVYTFGPKDGTKAIVAHGYSLMADGASLASSLVTMGVCVRNAVELIGLTPQEAVTMATINPARVVKLQDRKGHLAPGKDADLVILDQDLSVVRTIVGGKTIYAAQ